MSLKNVLIGGGSGFIGQRLKNLLNSSGFNVTIISRMPGLRRITWLDIEKNGLPKDTGAVVNLAGQNALDPSRRWTAGFKQNIFNSRINTTAALARAIQQAEVRPKVFVAISGVSHYKPHPTKTYDESHPGDDFDYMSKLCIEWEKAAALPVDIGTRLVKIRTGAVVGREGGMIRSLILPFYFGLGGPIGDGSHFLPWIHVDDLCGLIKFAIENEKVEGVLNGVAPQIITNGEFTKAFAAALRRPALIPLPEFVLNLIFNKERAVILSTGARIEPKRPKELGFSYKYPDIRSACIPEAKLF